MNIPISFPTDIYGWIAVVAIVIAGIFFVRGRDIKRIRENAEDLRAIVDDKTKEIDSLRAEMKIMQVRIDELEKRNRTLEDLVIVSLKQYFFENPDVAIGVKEKVMK